MTQKFTAEEVLALFVDRKVISPDGSIYADARRIIDSANTLSKPADSGRVGYEFLWQEGQAGEANIVTFNGEDVRGVARIEKDSVRAQLIRSHNNALRSALAAQGQGEACSYCNGSGDVHSIDGEWRGECTECPAAMEREFKNFHRQLCERFGYTHDEKDWRRDQVSLIEHIAMKLPAPASGVPDGCIPIHRTLLDKLATDMDAIDMPKIGAAIRRGVANYDARQSAAPSAPEGDGGAA